MNKESFYVCKISISLTMFQNSFFMNGFAIFIITSITDGVLIKCIPLSRTGIPSWIYVTNFFIPIGFIRPTWPKDTLAESPIKIYPSQIPFLKPIKSLSMKKYLQLSSKEQCDGSVSINFAKSILCPCFESPGNSVANLYCSKKLNLFSRDEKKP